MSRNGSGTYNLPAGNPVVSGSVITSAWANTTLTDIANALTGSLASDGQTPASGDLNMAANQIKDLADPTLDQDATTVAWVNAAIATAVAPPFVAGTYMLFIQTAAPTGWTKSTTHNNKALRIVSGTAGTGGSVDFTTAFASQSVAGTNDSTTATGSVGTSGATTLSTSQIPSHTHDVNASSAGNYGNFTTGNYFAQTSESGGYIARDNNNYTVSGAIASAGSGGSHTHSGGTFTGTAHTHTFTGTAINLAVAYVDAIIAVKN